MDSILISVKKALGISEDDTNFDVDVILNINSALMILCQLGIGPDTGYLITDDTATWEDFLGDRLDLEAVKIYVYLKTRVTFDPPTSSALLDSIERQLTQLEWRLNVQAEGGVIVD